MFLLLSSLLFVSVAVDAAAIASAGHELQARDTTSNDTQPLALPMSSGDPAQRAQEIQLKRQGYLYGPSVMGNSSFFPTGTLGDAMVQRDSNPNSQFHKELGYVYQAATADLKAAASAITAAGGLKKISDYDILYDNQWKTSVPSGVDAGQLTNYTQDLLFSMERLSVNPYPVRRLNPIKDTLPFPVDTGSVQKLAGTDLQTLFKTGSLFYVDHSSQAKLPKTGRYSAACEAYFYIHPQSKDFLPLAIKPNAGGNLVYTPLDQANDWLLAKIMFNVNDLFHGQGYHLVNSHAVAEIVHQAAIRTLSDDHPILAVLNRLMYEGYAMRPQGAATLTNKGGIFDQYFANGGDAFAEFCSTTYYQSAGAFQENYFEQNLISRGLLNCEYGPALKSFPFLEDAGLIRSKIQDFMSRFIKSYYSTDALLGQDEEVQAWITEASGPAQVIDFPTSLKNTATLIDILTHFAYLTGVSHHVLNLGDPAVSSGLLPFHPAALYSPIPTEKNISDLMPFLPPVNQTLGQILVFAVFNRPQFVGTNMTLSNMFVEPNLLSRLNSQTVTAAQTFHSDMLDVSKKVQARGFDGKGLSQGMPFVWKSLDPEAIPFFFAV